MHPPSQFIDSAAFPQDESTHILDMANKHNALNADVDRISGATADEKEETHMMFEKIRKLNHRWQTRRFGISLLTLEVGFIMFILDKLGLNTRLLIPDLVRLLQILKN